MYNLFGSIKKLTKIGGIDVDNNVFKLHYKVTVLFLIAFSILVTSKQFIGESISCISKDDIPTRVLDTYCWIHTTFSIEESWFKKVGVEVPYPGVDKYTPGEKRTYHAYYQWVCFVLFLQGVMFYIPKYLWRIIEGGRVKALVLELNSSILTQKTKEENTRILVDYFSNNLNQHNFYAYGYFFCEMLNFINVIGQMYLMDTFLGGMFSTYGSNISHFDQWDWTVRYNPMIKVFPRLTKCTFHRFGSSGDVQKHDAMCILPINIINEKIYVFIWFWFVILSILSGLVLVYRLIVVLSPSIRVMVLKLRAGLDESNQTTELKKCSVGDWFLLYLFSKNFCCLNFRYFIGQFVEQVDLDENTVL